MELLESSYNATFEYSIANSRLWDDGKAALDSVPRTNKTGEYDSVHRFCEPKILTPPTALLVAVQLVYRESARLLGRNVGIHRRCLLHPYEKVVDDLSKFPGTKWFPGARLNYEEQSIQNKKPVKLPLRKAN